jgi:hypothetical protein
MSDGITILYYMATLFVMSVRLCWHVDAYQFLLQWKHTTTNTTNTSLLCHFSLWRQRQHLCPKSRHRPTNTHGAKTQDFYNNIIITAVRISNLIKQNHVTCIFVCTWTWYLPLREENALRLFEKRKLFNKKPLNMFSSLVEVMLMVWAYVSVVRPPTGLFFIPEAIYEYEEPRWNDTDRENRITRRKTTPTATLSTTNPTWDDWGANTGLRGERSAANLLSHGKTSGFIKVLYRYLH